MLFICTYTYAFLKTSAQIKKWFIKSLPTTMSIICEKHKFIWVDKKVFTEALEEPKKYIPGCVHVQKHICDSNLQ